jgi:hypothetical protein
MSRSRSQLSNEIVSMALQGMTPKAIAEAKNMVGEKNRIYMILHKARKAGAPIARHNGVGKRGEPGTLFRISISAVMHREKLARAAARRSLTRTQLLNRMVSIALQEGLIDSILDDGVTSDA